MTSFVLPKLIVCSRYDFVRTDLGRFQNLLNIGYAMLSML
jgi:hypothetical protein